MLNSLKPIFILMIVVLFSKTTFAQNQEAQKMLAQALATRDDGKLDKAIKQLTAIIQKDEKHATAYYYRGRVNFRTGKIADSIADFDQFVKLKPKQEKVLWERGISHYYAKQYDNGAKQFALYQTYRNNDVENSVWRYNCMAPKHGVEKAKKSLMKIKNDRRVPFMEIYAMYQEKLTPAQVLKATQQGKPTKEQMVYRMFYAHLYIGLYYEANGKNGLAKKHLTLAAEKYKNDHYMWDVAHVHVNLLKKKKK